MSAVAGLLCFCLSHKLKAKTVPEIKEYLVQNEYWNDINMMTYFYEDYSALGGATNNHWTVFFMDFGNATEEFENYISILLSGIEMKSEIKKFNYAIYESENFVCSIIMLFYRRENYSGFCRRI